MVFHYYLGNGFIDFQKNNTIETALMRPFHRLFKLENKCRNKEMASYFAKMTFFKNQQKDTGWQELASLRSLPIFVNV